MVEARETALKKIQKHQSNTSERRNNFPLPAATQLQGTISLPIGERLVTDHDSDTGFELSSEEQTEKTDSIRNNEPIQKQPQDSIREPKTDYSTSNALFNTERGKKLQDRIL